MTISGEIIIFIELQGKLTTVVFDCPFC